MPDIAINGERDILSVRIDAVTDEVRRLTQFFKVLQASHLRAFC
jgi:hypothetical protein